MRTLVLACLACLIALPAAAERITVLAAASLTDALTEVAALHEARTGTGVRLSFAASSALARQIEAGAPAHVFASADEAWMDWLAERGRIAPDSRIAPVGNRLALVAPADAPPATGDIAGAIGAAEGRIAIADPDAVPAGRYAREALAALGLWQEVRERLAPAEHVRAALALVARGAAPLGIVYATDAAVSGRVTVAALFPADSHAPVRYPFAAVAERDGPAARAFLATVASPEALRLFAAHGFAVE